MHRDLVSVSQPDVLEDQAALLLGAFQNLTFERTHRADFPIAERSARMARMLADVLAPGANDQPIPSV